MACKLRKSVIIDLPSCFAVAGAAFRVAYSAASVVIRTGRQSSGLFEIKRFERDGFHGDMDRVFVLSPRSENCFQIENDRVLGGIPDEHGAR